MPTTRPANKFVPKKSPINVHLTLAHRSQWMILMMAWMKWAKTWGVKEQFWCRGVSEYMAKLWNNISELTSCSCLVLCHIFGKLRLVSMYVYLLKWNEESLVSWKSKRNIYILLFGVIIKWFIAMQADIFICGNYYWSKSTRFIWFVVLTVHMKQECNLLSHSKHCLGWTLVLNCYINFIQD